MRSLLTYLLVVSCGAALFALVTFAQDDSGSQSERRVTQRSEARAGEPSDTSSIVARMMAFDANKDGKLTRDEITDPRLLRLFDRADTNNDGIVTREELVAFAAKIKAEEGGPEAGGPDDGFGPGGPGGLEVLGGPDPVGGGGRGPSRFGPPRPGQILPPFVRERLNLSDDQSKQIDELQKEVDEKLAKILTDEQKRQLKASGNRGPRGDFPGGPTPGGDRPDEHKGAPPREGGQ